MIHFFILTSFLQSCHNSCIQWSSISVYAVNHYNANQEKLGTSVYNIMYNSTCYSFFFLTNTLEILCSFFFQSLIVLEASRLLCYKHIHACKHTHPQTKQTKQKKTQERWKKKELWHCLFSICINYYFVLSDSVCKLLPSSQQFVHESKEVNIQRIGRVVLTSAV